MLLWNDVDKHIETYVSLILIEDLKVFSKNIIISEFILEL